MTLRALSSSHLTKTSLFSVDSLNKVIETRRRRMLDEEWN